MGFDILDDSRLEAKREFVPIKRLGTGSFGSVFVVDWHSPLPSGTMVPAMQHSYTRPEYVGKRIVAMKKMKRTYKSREDCLSLCELRALLSIPTHDNIISMYDVFRKPSTHELYLVFECMEGNLYQLIKSRKGRAMAPGLIASITQQALAGIEHVHAHGFFHRDMKPENLLITTTGVGDYPLTCASQENVRQDVLVIVKIADFGLACKIDQDATFTTYVSTRWYRAPEILLQAQHYSASVDIWAIGAILAEMVRLDPIFPGASALVQLQCILNTLGTPAHHVNSANTASDGTWLAWLNAMKSLDRSAYSRSYDAFCRLFPSGTSATLLDMIFHMLDYDPTERLTAKQCLEHPYIVQEAPLVAPVRRFVPEPFYSTTGTTLSYDTDSPNETDSAGSPVYSADTQNDLHVHSEPFESEEAVKRPDVVAHDEQHHLLFSKLPLLHRSHGLHSGRSAQHLFSIHGRKKQHNGLPRSSNGPMPVVAELEDDRQTCRPRSEGCVEHPPQGHFRLESSPSTTWSSTHLLQKLRKSLSEKETNSAERKRREDERLILRERSRAVIQNRASFHDQNVVQRVGKWSSDPGV